MMLYQLGWIILVIIITLYLGKAIYYRDEKKIVLQRPIIAIVYFITCVIIHFYKFFI